MPSGNKSSFTSMDAQVTPGSEILTSSEHENLQGR